MAIRKINMIPSYILTTTALARHLRFWGKGILVLTALFAGAYLISNQWLKGQQQQNGLTGTTLMQINEKINETLQVTDEIRSKMKDLHLKINTLSTITNQRPYYDILGALAQAVNKDTWIDHLSVQRCGEKKMDCSNIMMEGFSMTHHTLGVFLESLSGIPKLENMVLVNAKQHEQVTAGLNLSRAIRFKLSCSITGVSQ